MMLYDSFSCSFIRTKPLAVKKENNLGLFHNFSHWFHKPLQLGHKLSLMWSSVFSGRSKSTCINFFSSLFALLTRSQYFFPQKFNNFPVSIFIEPMTWLNLFISAEDLCKLFFQADHLQSTRVLLPPQHTHAESTEQFPSIFSRLIPSVYTTCY